MKIFNIIKNKIKNKEMNFKEKGENVHIERGSSFHYSENISLGDNVYLGPNSTFFGQGGITIGSGSILAHKVEILTTNHNYDSNNLQSIPYDKESIMRPVTIKENVWIGSNVYIVPGVTIEEGAVIGMGAVVTKDIPKYAVVGGNPAKVIKYRNAARYEKLKQENKIYLKLKFER